jgi:small subunit ribosomal protein S13
MATENISSEQILPNQSSAPRKRGTSIDFRIEGIQLENKRICIALTKIYGIGKPTALKICEELNINPDSRPSDISEEEIAILRDYIKNYIIVEGNLKQIVITNIQRKIAINSYQGLRHRFKLPVRGQNTRKNARTRKGKKTNPIANKKKVTK